MTGFKDPYLLLYERSFLNRIIDIFWDLGNSLSRKYTHSYYLGIIFSWEELRQKCATSDFKGVFRQQGLVLVEDLNVVLAVVHVLERCTFESERRVPLLLHQLQPAKSGRIRLQRIITHQIVSRAFLA